MSDATVDAEKLISTVARAFYEDDAIVLIDILLKDKFLRDDDMGPRLKLQPKQLRKTLQFLEDEHLVKYEEVDDLAEGGSQASKFWYIDYHQAVHSIRLRVYLLRQKLQQAELAARSSSFYLCPGYKEKRCNGRYSEEEAQSVVDPETGLFLCRECYSMFENSPNPPPIDSYTLRLVDNAKELQLAVDNLRRVNVQFSQKMVKEDILHDGIYDLLKQVDKKRKGTPLSSNYPSENRDLQIGSKRLEGTGRTFGIKIKKQRALMQESGEGGGGGGGAGGPGGRRKRDEEEDLLHLKDAYGQKLKLQVEKGVGTRAQVLATHRQRRRKLMDAAAARVATKLPVALQVYRLRKRKLEEEAAKRKASSSQDNNNGSKSKKPKGPEFLENNLGLTDERNQELDQLRQKSRQLLEEEENNEEYQFLENLVDLAKMEEDETLDWPDEKRRMAFQAQYKKEMGRQLKLLKLDQDGNRLSKLVEEASTANLDPEEVGVVWEDG